MQLAPLVDFDLDVLDRMHRTNIRGTFVIDHDVVLDQPVRVDDRDPRATAPTHHRRRRGAARPR
jgi:hypothetical protein